MKTLNELNHYADVYGWKKGPLTFAKIKRMTADEADWHSRVNAEEFNRAYNEPKTKAESEKNAEDAKAQKYWTENTATTESVGEVRKFCAAYPQFLGKYLPNREAVTSWLREKNLAVTFANLATAFQALAAEGNLLVNPSAIGIGTEEEIGGSRLKHHPELWRLLEPAPTAEQKAKIAEQKMSAADYREAHREDWREDRISDRQQQSWNKAIAFFMESRPDYKATESNRQKLVGFIFANGLQVNVQSLEVAYKSLKAKGELELNEGAVQEGQTFRYTNLAGTGDVRNLQTALPEKESLAYKVNKMSAAEYAAWIQNPANRRAVDSAVAH